MRGLAGCSCALALAGVVGVVLIGWQTALAITVVTAAATVIQLAVLLGVLRRYGRITRRSRARVRSVLASTRRSVVSGAGLLVSSRLDQLLFSVLVAPQVLGVYAVAASFGAII